MNKITLMGCCIVVGLLSYTSAGVADTPPKVSSLKGAFEAEVTLRTETPDCTSGQIIEDGGPNPFGTMYTFNKGGTMNEFGWRFSPALRTPGFGVWRRTGQSGSEFHTRYRFHTFDGNGLEVFKIDVTGNMSVTDDGNHLSGVARYLVTDISGNSFTRCAVIDGERINF